VTRRLLTTFLGLAALAAVATVPAVADPDTSGTLIDGVPLCGVAAGTAAPAPASGLRVATFNLMHAESDEGDQTLAARLPEAADAIVAGGVDVIGLQEVTRNETFVEGDEYPLKHGTVAQRMAEALSARTGEAWEWCWSQSNPHWPLTPDIEPGGGNPIDDLSAAMGNFPDPGDFREGVAIVTRYHITHARFRHLLPRSYEAPACIPSGDPFCAFAALLDARQILWARVAVPGRGQFDMFTTHIAHDLTPLSDTTKLLQVKQVLHIVDEWSTPDAFPDFLVGDFNSDPTTDRYAAVTGAGFVDTFAASGGAACAVPGDGGCTGDPPSGQESFTATPARDMAERIDYVFARPPATCALTVPSSTRLATVPVLQPDGRWLWASDHLGVRSTVSC